nr:uncharacterized protein LOC113806118 [Penaeus vannamei]
MQPAGYAHQPTPPLVYEAPVTLASVTPSRGGVGGGYDLVIRGDGLPSTSQGGGQRRVRGGRPLPSHGRGPWLRGVRGAAWGSRKGGRDRSDRGRGHDHEGRLQVRPARPRLRLQRAASHLLRLGRRNPDRYWR